MTSQDRHELIKAACEDCRAGILSKDAALQLAYHVLVTLEKDGMNDKDYAEAIIKIEEVLGIKNEK